MNSRPPKEASSHVSWSLLMEGVATARVDLHRLRLLLDRAQTLVDTSADKEQLWRVAGDLILGIPTKVHEIEVALDRTSYAMALMGEDFLRGRIPLDDRSRVEEGIKPHPMTQKESVLAAKVAGRYLDNKKVAPSAEDHFFDGPKNREVREFAISGAISNFPDSAAVASRHMDLSESKVKEAVKDSKNAPPEPLEIRKAPGGKDFSTLNRYIVETEQPGNKGVPEGRDEIPKHPILKRNGK